jgi:putative membrane protein
MNKFILRWLINVAGIFAAIWIVPGIGFENDWTGVIWLALIMGLLNALVRPLLKLLTCPLIVLTLGLFTLLINTFIFWLTTRIGQNFGIGIAVDGFWSAFLGGLVVSVVSVIMTMILRDELKEKG